MPRKKLPYKEGSWFAVPLEDSGYALGLVTRAAPAGKVLFGYFFGPRRIQVPELSEVAELLPEDAVLRRMFGDLGLINGDWPVIGESEDWNRDAWPQPLLVRKNTITGQFSLIEYSEDDPNHEIAMYECPAGAVQEYPEDGLSGYIAVQIRLTRLLSS